MKHEFFMAMNVPTTTHQQKKVRVVKGKPIFYEPQDLSGYLLKSNIKMSFEGEEWFEEVTKPLSHIPGDQMKYLGNVYENPELLEQQQ